jgi:hypothetical protein
MWSNGIGLSQPGSLLLGAGVVVELLLLLVLR